MANIAERRNVLATLYMGVTEIIVGVVMVLTGAADWYFETFHFFGVLGMGGILYAYWYCFFYRQDTGETLWRKKK